ncbi:hypothetical protein, partial [Chamaesiphon polymorphus]|uniref:hypothetical protein n=1 Tax=Chamaesiphon polymorphus TaxID=2107691 RepID=UPI001C62CAA2
MLYLWLNFKTVFTGVVGSCYLKTERQVLTVFYIYLQPSRWDRLSSSIIRLVLFCEEIVRMGGWV